MEEVFSNDKQVQVKTETVTPDKVVSTKEWGSVEPVPKRAREAWDLPEPKDEEKYLVVEELVNKIKKIKENKIEIDGQIITEILTVNGIRFSFEDGSWGLIEHLQINPH